MDVKLLDSGCLVQVTKCGDCSNVPVIKDELNYVFYDENLIKVSNISDFVKKLQNRSQNFFLFHKNIKVKL